MALTFKTGNQGNVKVESYGHMKPFWLEPTKKDVMGYALSGVAKGDYIPQGYPVKCDDANKTAVLCKYIQVVEKVSATEVYVRKNSLAKVGEKYLNGSTALTISTIEDAGQYDKVKFSASHGITDACNLPEANGTEVKALPNRIISEDQNMTANDQTVSAVHSGIVLKNIVNYPAEYINSTAFPGSDLLVGCPAIMFITQ